MITYIKGDLFSAPQDRLLVHACNCQGVWGSGVAKTFKQKFYDEWGMYHALCHSYDGERTLLRGQALIVNRVGALFTSLDYGDKVDTPELILENTQKAMMDLTSKTNMKLAMPKINSGLFKVPWEETEEILNKFDVDIWVYEL